MAEIHKCGQGWAYCDGNCTTCAVNNHYTTTNGTITLVKDYPPYLDYPKEQKKEVRTMTNADKYIRNATDEELARFIAKAQADILRTVGRALKYQGDLVRDCDLEDAADDWLIWLKQEVKNDGGTNDAKLM